MQVQNWKSQISYKKSDSISSLIRQLDLVQQQRA